MGPEARISRVAHRVTQRPYRAVSVSMPGCVNLATGRDSATELFWARQGGGLRDLYNPPWGCKSDAAAVRLTGSWQPSPQKLAELPWLAQSLPSFSGSGAGRLRPMVCVAEPAAESLRQVIE